MADNSDYNKPRTNLFELLPEVNQSETSRSLFENLFNRFLTKQETEKVAGYIGEGNPDAIIKRKVKEPTVHRQGYQLQPILHNKIGSEEHMASWYDILNEAERLGVDRERMQEWLNIIQFNWAPPIDFDKFIHYQDYYWYDEDKPNSAPQYLTIRSRCSTATALVNFYESLVKEYGEHIQTIRAGEVDDELPTFSVVDIIAGSNAIIVDGDISPELNEDQYFNLTGTLFNSSIYRVAAPITYNVSTKRSTIYVTAGSLSTDESNIGTVSLQRFNKLIIKGEYTRLFEPGFIFMYKNSINTELNNAYWKVVESTFDGHVNETTITINTVYTHHIVNGVISQEESLQTAVAARDCQCNGSIGWDLFQWDDNPNIPLWDGTHQTLISAISNPAAPTVPGTDGELWWDTDGDRLYQYTEENEWKVLWNSFSVMVNSTLGQNFWDRVPGCGQNYVIAGAEQWISQNKWLHKTDVPNFSVSKQATLPIIEYDWDLELNEWTYTTYKWKYRSDNNASFKSVDSVPELIELTPLEDWTTPSTYEIVLSEKYGDLTSYFTPGKLFMGIGNSEIMEVESSFFQSTNPGEPHTTIIKVTEDVTASGLVPGVTNLRPIKTSLGENWKGHDIHWLFDGVKETLPVNHQPLNKFTEIEFNQTPVNHSSGEYNYTFTYYAQEANIAVEKNIPTFLGVTVIELTDTVLGGTNISLRKRAPINTNSIRVYINDIRQYGTYNERTEADLGIGTDTLYVAGIEFMLGFELDKYDNVRIEVGEVTPKDIGKVSVPVRTIEDNDEYALAGNEYVSIVNYHKVEQVKSKTNQYPLFDIYNVDGSSAYKASPIISYVTNPENDVIGEISLRLETDTTETDYVFQQHLLSNTNEVQAYRDYWNRNNDFWVNPQTQEVKFWDGYTWTDKLYVDKYYIGAYVGDEAPGAPYSTIAGMYWYDTTANILKRRVLSNTWEDVFVVFDQFDDETLQTIWKKGLNDELYIPEKRDWEKRSLEEYNDEKDLYIENVLPTVQIENPGLTDTQYYTKAEAEWNTTQRNDLSTNGQWVGEWEVPDPLYYNVSHENREVITFRELLTHFTSVIDSQPKLPGFNGPRETMFHLIPSNEVNYGLGGKIKEYQYGLDLFLSSLFINEVSPRGLIDFAHDQYEALLNNLQEVYKKNVIDYLLSVDTETFSNQSQYIADKVITQHEQSDFYGIMFGDSTTFTEVEGGDDLGIRNWIATLPYLHLQNKTQPINLYDPDVGINEVIHHDSHRANYSIGSNNEEGIIFTLVTSPDYRAQYPDPQNPTNSLYDTYGTVSYTDLPPNTVSEFNTIYNTTILNRKGVYWYHIDGTEKTLYRLNVVDIGADEPSLSHDDGTLWLDLTPSQEVLRVKKINEFTGNAEWAPVDGLYPGFYPIRLHNGTDSNDINTSTVSAWQVTDLDDLLRSVIIEAEDRLFENAPSPYKLKYDFDSLREQFPILYDSLLSDTFLDYVKEKEITNPFENSEYSSTDPFTWNYKYSSPGQTYEIIDTNTTHNYFTLKGDAIYSLSLGMNIYIKNSDINDGMWKTHSTIPATLVGGNTVVYVEGREVQDTYEGLVYTGILPSLYDMTSRPANKNTGAESGGYWKDYYNKIYGTPYPHLEPWVLQGYGEKPNWWDEEYLNQDPIKWGDRRWKYKHGFDVVGVDVVQDYFQIDGNFIDLFYTSQGFEIDRSDITYQGGQWKVASYSPITAGITGGAGASIIEIPGDYQSILLPNLKLGITDSSNNFVQQVTVQTAIFTGPPYNHTIVTLQESISDMTGFDFISGATYDPIERVTTIRIDTTATTPYRNDITVSLVEGRITKAYGMWENVRTGVIPAGRTYPSGFVSTTGNPAIDLMDPLPTWDYFSVNVDNYSTAGIAYHVDDILPPYWDRSTTYPGTAGVVPFDLPIRSIMSHFNEVRSPATNYAFNDVGVVEWDWKNSSQYLYDQLTVAFQLDPVRFMHSTYGPEFYYIAGMPISKFTSKVMSHNNTSFHGDISGSVVDKYDGLNQWYVDFTHMVGVDISMSDFRSMWTNWKTPMMYQFASFVDTPSFNLAHRHVCISEFDYSIASKKSAGVEDYQIDAFRVEITRIPPKISRYDNEGDWRFNVNVSSTKNNLQYYDVRRYQFVPDLTTNECLMYTWNVTGTNVFYNTVTIPGDQTSYFEADGMFNIEDSTNNNGTYIIFSSSYNPVSNETVILLSDETTILSNIFDGIVRLQYREHPWNTGDRVVLSTQETIPVPLRIDDDNGIYEYFIIVDNNDRTKFKLALTANDATAGNEVDITTVGRGNAFVGQIHSTFKSSATTTAWKHYVVDTSAVITSKPPFEVKGIQNLINIVDGYETKVKEDGWVINSDNMMKDPNTGNFVNYQSEIIRVIDYMSLLRSKRSKVNDKYEATINTSTNTWTFDEYGKTSQMITGDAVTVYVSDNIYPTPIVAGNKYYMIRDSLTDFRLAYSKADAKQDIAINITSIAGVNKVFVAPASTLETDRPKFEINPLRNGIWFRPERGIVSNIIDGPSNDVYNTQLLLDQYGRSIGRNNIRIYREDKETHIAVADGILNDVELTSIFDDPYNYIHMSSMHLFVDTYEHVLIFNNETTEGQLLYDSFVGLNVTKFEVLFNKQPEFIQRPNVGGQYLQTYYNQGADLNRNIEASIDDIRNLYDTYTTFESNTLTSNARKSLGYTGRKNYLDNLNINEKSQFAYWRGQIQNKGSLNSFKAFVNSRRFIDAKVDEFWAFKVAEYGSVAEKEYVSMWVSTEDTRSNELRLNFVESDDICHSGYSFNPYDSSCGYSYPVYGELVNADSSFLTITLADEDRWYDQPLQLEKLRNNGGTMYFELKPYSKRSISNNIKPSIETKEDWLDVQGNISTLKHWNPNLLHEYNIQLITNSYEVRILGDQREHIREHQLFEVMETTYNDGTFRVAEAPTYDGTYTIIMTDTVFLTETLVEGKVRFWGKWENHGSWDNTSPEPLQLRHNMNADHITMTLDVYPEPFTVTYDFTSTTAETKEMDTTQPFIPTTGGIELFKDGVRLTGRGVDYMEPIDDNVLFSTNIIFRDDIAGSVIKVVYKTSTLVQGLHFEQVTTDIIKIHFPDMIGLTASNINMWGWIIDKEARNPAKIIDMKAETVITPIQVWDPARGCHYYNGVHAVDLQRASDPAYYSNTSNSDVIRRPNEQVNIHYPNVWNAKEVGTTWLDTDHLDYLPYYDTKVLPNIDDRSRLWGELADWSELKLYTWVESDISPEEWDAVAAVEEGDITINENIRKSGVAKQTLYEKNENDEWVIARHKRDQFDVSIEGTSYQLRNIKPRDLTITAVDAGTITVDGDYSRRLLTGMLVDVTDGVTTEQHTVESVESDGNTTTITFVSTGSPFTVLASATNAIFFEQVNVYKNGVLVLENHSIDPSGIVTLSELEEFDRVVVMQLIPMDEDFIAAEIESGMLLRDYQYTIIEEFDDLGLPTNKYYFWVENVATKGTHDIAPKEAQLSLVNIPIPYMFFENVKPAVRIDYAGEQVDMPTRFSHAIIKGIRGIVNDDFRYVIRWTRDFTLRDSLIHGTSALQKKNLHEEWEMLRREQLSHIPRWLWDKVTESMVGYKLDNPGVRVPSTEHELYDAENGTDTQYGMGNGQTFVNGALAKATIIDNLTDLNNDFKHVDINVFFANNSFDTPEEIIISMDTIYNTFSYLDVNKMFFDCLLDAFSTKDKYEDIFKTSMVALHGVRPFQVGGLFDD